jgi:polysaccharide export outer membrane protein
MYHNGTYIAKFNKGIMQTFLNRVCIVIFQEYHIVTGVLDIMKKLEIIKNHTAYFLLLISVLFSGCVSSKIETKEPANIPNLSIKNKDNDEIQFATPEIIKMYEANLAKDYYIGPGDQIKIEIWNRPELSGEHLVGPFGKITLPLIGEFNIGGNTVKEATKSIKDAYSKLYYDPIVMVTILKYMNNKVYVLGRVTNPGIVHLDGHATILEALSMAGGLPTLDKTAFLSKCYIIRGKEQIIWIDLLQLLGKANMKLNIGLANNDIIYIPDSTDASVFVMGEVKNPGSYPIQTSGMSFLDAINQAGGPTENANETKIRLIRDMREQKSPIIINLDEFLKNGNFAQNQTLQDNDIIYVPKKGIASFNYYLRQIDPFLRTFITANLVQDEISD